MIKKVPTKKAQANPSSSEPSPIALGLRFGDIGSVAPLLWIVWIDDAWFHGLLPTASTRGERCVFAQENTKSFDSKLDESGNQILCESRSFMAFTKTSSGGFSNFFLDPNNWNNTSSDFNPPTDNSDGKCLKELVKVAINDKSPNPIGVILMSFEGFLKWRNEIRSRRGDAFVVFDVKHQAAATRCLKIGSADFSSINVKGLTWDNLGLGLMLEEMCDLVSLKTSSVIPFRLSVFTTVGSKGGSSSQAPAYEELLNLIQGWNNTNPANKITELPRIWLKTEEESEVAGDIWAHAKLLWGYKIEAFREAMTQLGAMGESKSSQTMDAILDAWWSELQGPKDLRAETSTTRRRSWEALSEGGVLDSTIRVETINTRVESSDRVESFAERRVGGKCELFRFQEIKWQLSDKGSDAGLRSLEKSLSGFPSLVLVKVNVNEGERLRSNMAKALDWVRRLRLRWPQLTIVVETAHHGHRAEEAFYRAGANAVYHSPEYPDIRSALDPNVLDQEGHRLFSDYWSHHQSLYQVPGSVGISTRGFVDCGAPAWSREHVQLLENLKLDKLAPADPKIDEVRRLLRALFPNAHTLRIVKVLRGGGTEGVPFVVAARDAAGHESKAVQVKLHPDWRAIDAERRGFEDVVAYRLGSSIAHVVNGPLRVGRWSGMVQSFAAREDSGPESDSPPKSLEDALKDVLHQDGAPRRLARELFQQLLVPLYGAGKGEKKQFPVLRLLSKQGPAIVQAEFVPACEPAHKFDFTPEILSLKHARHRAGCAAREWRRLLTISGETDPVQVSGWRLETLEAVDGSATRRRARFTDEATGLKIDVNTVNADTAEQAQALIDSPLPLRGLRPEVFLKPASGWLDSFTSTGNPWIGLRSELAGVGVIPDEGLKACGGLDPFEWLWLARPLDWHEDFRFGPTHGDLNLGNALVAGQDGTRVFSMIAFDQAENEFPIAFDLAKLEWESLTKVGAKKIGELHDQLSAMVGRVAPSLAQLAEAVERTVVSEADGSVEGILRRFGYQELCTPGDLLCRELNGYLEWRRAVASEGYKLGVDRHQRLHALFAYGFASLKFKNLRDDGKTMCGARPAEIALYSLQSLILELDALDGVFPKQKPAGPSRKSAPESEEWQVSRGIEALRKEAKDSPSPNRRLAGVLWGDESNPDSVTLLAERWKTILEAFVAKHHPGGGRWMREILWFVRDRKEGKLGSQEEVAGLTLAMVWVSEFASRKDFSEVKDSLRSRFKVGDFQQFHDFGSTGRLGNVFPIGRFFQELAKTQDRRNVIKISSSGESGGTVDLLEAAGIALAESYDAVQVELEKNRDATTATSWAMAKPEKHLCSVDKALMRLRKETDCMGSGDLVIASVTAKKLCVGITSFDQEVVTGWDSKFRGWSENSYTTDPDRMAEQWGGVWHILDKELGNDKHAILRPLNFYSSDSGLAKWEWSEVKGANPLTTVGSCPLTFSVGSKWLAVGAVGKFLSQDDWESLKGSNNGFFDSLEPLMKLGKIIQLCEVNGTDVVHGPVKCQIWSKSEDLLSLALSTDGMKNILSEFSRTSALLFQWQGGKALNTQFLDGFYSTRLSKPVHPWSGMAMWTKNEIDYCLVIAPQTGPDELEALGWDFALGAFRAMPLST